jgi:hypothetical protein
MDGIMKSTAWKKDYFVVRHDEFNDRWYSLTVPCTYLQAVRFSLRTHGKTKIVSSAELATLTGAKQ